MTRFGRRVEILGSRMGEQLVWREVNGCVFWLAVMETMEAQTNVLDIRITLVFLGSAATMIQHWT